MKKIKLQSEIRASSTIEQVKDEHECLAAQTEDTILQQQSISGYSDNMTQTESINYIDKMTETCAMISDNFFKKPFEDEIKKLQDKILHMSFNYETCYLDVEKFSFYTGLSNEHFIVLWNFLGEETSNLVIWRGKKNPQSKGGYKRCRIISPKNQLFLTLVRLRCGILLKDLAYRFDISESYASKIITTWITFMYNKFKKLSIFPDRETDVQKIPKVFRKFKNIRVIIDGFEVRTQKPKDYREQGNVYSNYKASSTHKFLVGIHVCGAVCFLSDSFEGSVSDRDLFLKCGILSHLNKNDVIMADRGFNIADICNEMGLNVVVPPFLSGRDKLTKDEVTMTRNIASARIHVERTIGRIKGFRILQKVIPKTLVSIISQMTFVICMLVNFQEPLVK